MKQLLAALILAPAIAHGAGTITLQGTDFRADTVAHYPVAPGTTHTHLTLTAGNRTVQVYYNTLDRAAGLSAGVTPRVLVGKDQCQTAESMTSMALRHSNADRRYFAGVNGDFFITSAFANQHALGNQILGYPNMACAIDGVLVAPDAIDAPSRNSALMIGPDGAAWIDAPKITVKILNNDGSVNLTSGYMNFPIAEGAIQVYNRYNGPTTRTPAGTREIVLQMAEGAQWQFNKSTKFTATGGVSISGNSAIPENGAVIALGPNVSNEFLENIAAGETVKIKPNLTLPSYDNFKAPVQEMIGGDVRILNNGTVTTEAIRWINTPGSLYPRSVCGISEDGNLVVMAAIDGGSAVSSGMSYYEAADLLKALGCYNGLDLDGGGSTALYLRHGGIVNHPRDGSERAIGNALYFAIDAPDDATLSSIVFEDHARRIPQFATYTPVVYGYNANGELMSTDVADGVVLSAPDGLSVDGRNVTALAPGCYALTARVGAMTATMPVTVVEVTDAAIAVTDPVIDGATPYVLPLTATVDGVTMPLDAKAFAWTSDNPSVIAVDPATGAMQGLSNGSATITASRGDLVLTANVRVETAPAPFMPLMSEWDADAWKQTKSGVALGNVTFNPDNNDLAIAYNITNSRAPKVSFARTITVYGRPAQMSVSLLSEGTSLKAFNLAVKTPTQSRPVTLSAKNIPAGEWTDAQWDLAAELEATELGSYPLTFSQFSAEPNGVGSDVACMLTVRKLGFNYSFHEAGIAEIATGTGDQPIVVTDGYVYAPGASTIEIYDLCGRLVALVRGQQAELPAAAGTYIIRAFGSACRTVKIMK